ncbi:helix-turn-helix domain-containing protein [Musicola keenii]|uniref:helix-turn-helix domain-containing protein n=1 Tax=Musicola keenii TaxID=2884250 RepID=UPI00177CB449|nr:AraC family transcriptional regulator [Musicola keenii]
MSAMVPAATDILTPVMPLSCQDRLFQQACDYMLKHLCEKILLDNVCQAVGTNRNKLSALFRARCGYGVARWLREQRLKKAAELLHFTDMSVCLVAIELGFSDAANFCNSFKSKYGISPREYRQSCIFHANK